jgi:phosphopantothenoylcysteine decarboxylase / phosphopantothenate---cysteine ligase
MSTKSAKRVVLGVTGSIAAYKACEIASTLTQRGIHVQPVLTRSAQELVGAATFEGLTGNRVITAMFDPATNVEIEHIAVSTGADLFLVAPASANILGKAANGIADDWLSTALLVTRAPILFAPAMNTNMYRHPAVEKNIETLAALGCHFVGPGSGRLACKTVGPGRMAEPEAVVEAALQLLRRSRDLTGKKVVITSGANHEPIDPVRFIGNRSSGKMGRALAAEALARGAEVTVIAGPSDVPPPAGATVIPVHTALEMREALLREASGAHIVIGAAAVADYRVEAPATEKRKRAGGPVEIRLVENPDLIAEVGNARRNGQIVVGFAAETNDLVENARKKLGKKGLDLIVANEVGTAESGFGTETIRARFLDAEGGDEEFPLVTKAELAERLFDRLAARLQA